jgi:hypothetical protein
MEEQEAAAAAAESVCCKEFQRCKFLLDKISESDEDTD